MQTILFEAIGNDWQIDITESLSSEEKNNLSRIILQRIKQFNSIYSRFDNNSFIYKISSKASIYKLPADAAPLFDLYQRLYFLTEGKFTPLIGKTLEDAGYDMQYTFRAKKLKPTLSWQETIEIDKSKLILKKPALLDFGAAGKGYLIDIISQLLAEEGILSYTIDASGDILCKSTGSSPLRIGLENPQDADQVIGVVSILNQSICGSAGNRRTWGNYHHIIDPYTLSSPTDILATWVISDQAIVADALATCLFLVQPEKLLNHFEYNYLILYKDFSLKKSDGFAAELFFDKKKYD